MQCLWGYQREWNDVYGRFEDRPRHDWTSHGADAMRYATVGFKRPIDLSGAPRKARTDYDMWGQ